MRERDGYMYGWIKSIIWINISGYVFIIWTMSSIFLPEKLLLRWLDANLLCRRLLIVWCSCRGPSRECSLPPGGKYNCLSYHNEFAISTDTYAKEIALNIGVFSKRSVGLTYYKQVVMNLSTLIPHQILRRRILFLFLLGGRGCLLLLPFTWKASCRRCSLR